MVHYRGEAICLQEVEDCIRRDTLVANTEPAHGPLPLSENDSADVFRVKMVQTNIYGFNYKSISHESCEIYRPIRRKHGESYSLLWTNYCC